jgi:hypothetical protein
VGPLLSTCVYCIDGADRIVSVDAAWDAFALANDGAHLVQSRVLQQPLWDYITGLETRLIYTHLLDSVRRQGHSLTFPFRCDAPGRRRYMEMRMTPRPAGGCAFHSSVMREEPRAPVPLLDASQPRRKDVVAQCSWCKKIDAGTGRWIEVEQAVTRLHLFEDRPLPQLLHTICKECAEAMDLVAG